MKKAISYTLTGLVAIIALSSCVNDLNTVPLNETDFTSESAYATPESYLNGLAYVESYLTLVSQNDPGSSDITVSDAGKSEFVRQYTNLNELSADSYKCTWGDSEMNGIQFNTWTAADNAGIIAVYTRGMKGITLVNEYLLQTTDAKLEARGHNAVKEEVAQYRAEARFFRAFFYSVLMDLYGNPPFATPDNIGGVNPKQIGRTALAEWIESELLDLTSEDSAMPERGEVAYPRPTKGAAEALLARLYLNWEVYTGTARWEDAMTAAKKVMDMGYTLHSNYQEMFMQDNGETCGNDEFIFCAAYDKDRTQSWGGTTHLISGSFTDSAETIATLLGITNTNTIGFPGEKWAGYHVADDYVARFDLKDVVWGTDGFGYNRETSDKRAFFFNGGRDKTFVVSTATTGWMCWKFTGLYSDGTGTSEADNTKFSSADFPFIRLAEMYLIYAEADLRLNGSLSADSKALIKALRDRAGVSMPADIDLDWLLDERARELMWEGQRRTDLIRYGYYTSMSFPWTFKGGVENGKVSLPEYRKIYPIPTSDLNANSSLVQNPGY